jgi:hypothetical protein
VDAPLPIAVDVLACPVETNCCALAIELTLTLYEPGTTFPVTDPATEELEDTTLYAEKLLVELIACNEVWKLLIRLCRLPNVDSWVWSLVTCVFSVFTGCRSTAINWLTKLCTSIVPLDEGVRLNEDEVEIVEDIVKLL